MSKQTNAVTEYMQYRRKYDAIMSSTEKSDQRDRRLSDLMKQIQVALGEPIRTERDQQRRNTLETLYQTVADSQSGRPPLDEYRQWYTEIMAVYPEGQQRDQQLAYLMTRMEQAFQIPALKDEQYEQNHQVVMKLYRRVSDSRR